ncbi:hypothetical protein [Sandaracinus amylolyticus]|uniref:hypothetical protein n=1 Tax=Sandaracinus amylolyticus TaxID=927083 RepID=UPI001F33984F|nr:hypothetical protein [Sandaracinus amylolyticus]UJR78930.1 Hypothetical protein I5071_9630 [Sandaracinus amylolyticus]
MSRLRFDPMPEKYERARKVVDESFRSLREVLDRGFRWREQVGGVVDTVIDTDQLPVLIDVPGVKTKPLAVFLLRAVPQRTSDGKVITSPAVQWEWRSGALLVHSVDGLAASTRYNATIAVME